MFQFLKEAQVDREINEGPVLEIEFGIQMKADIEARRSGSEPTGSQSKADRQREV